MVSAAGAVGAVVDAFAGFLEPMAVWLLKTSRWVALEGGDEIALFEISGRGPVLRGTSKSAADVEPFRLARGKDVELRLDPSRVVSRTIQLPSTGRDYAESIIQNRLERLTPWDPGTVLFGFASDDAAEAGPLLTFAFAATSQDLVAPTLVRLRAGGVVPTAIGPAGGPLETPLRIDLYRGGNDRVRRRLRRLAAGILVLVLALVVPIIGGSYWLAVSSARRLGAASAELTTLDAKLLEVANGQAQGDPGLRLLNAKTPETAMIFAIDRLATVLPDDTYLTELAMTQTELHITGISANAPALIPLLESRGGVFDVGFSAPVVRNAEGRDVFEIAAKRPAPPVRSP